MMETDIKVYAGIGTSNVEYEIEKAEMPIEELIERLEQLQSDGVTHVVGLTGNYRGAEYVRLSKPWFLEDDE